MHFDFDLPTLTNIDRYSFLYAILCAIVLTMDKSIIGLINSLDLIIGYWHLAQLGTKFVPTNNILNFYWCSSHVLYSCYWWNIKTYTNYLYSFIYGKNTILVPTFWSHSQFGPYILRAINLVPIIFKSQSIWSPPLYD